MCVGWATARPGVDIATVEAAYLEELEKLAAELPTDDEMARAKALTEADELGSLARVDERADRLSSYATLFDDPALINTHAVALPRGHGRGDPRRGAGGVPRGQPGGADVRPEAPVRRPRRTRAECRSDPAANPSRRARSTTSHERAPGDGEEAA